VSAWCMPAVPSVSLRHNVDVNASELSWYASGMLGQRNGVKVTYAMRWRLQSMMREKKKYVAALQ
jgi:hypothetical protein